MGLIRSLVKRALGMDKGADSARPRPAPSPSTGGPSETAAGRTEALKESLATLDAGAQEVKERLDCGEQITIVDVRTADEVAGGAIPGALHIPLQELDARWRELEEADEIVCYCAMGGRSLQAAKLLREKGLINATSLEGGVGAWTAAGGSLGALGG